MSTKDKMKRDAANAADRAEKAELHALKAARDRRKELEELKAQVQKNTQHLADLDQNFRALHTQFVHYKGTVKHLIQASNAASVVVSTMERFLDKEFAGWDEGARADMEKRSAGLQERAALADETRRKETTAERRVEIAGRLWELAQELGTEAVDVALILSIYLQARALEEAIAFVAKVREVNTELDKETEEVLVQLEGRIDQLRAEMKRAEAPEESEDDPPKLPPPGERRIWTP